LFHTLLPENGGRNVEKRDPEGNAKAALNASLSNLCACRRGPIEGICAAGICLLRRGPAFSDIAMAKGQMRSNKEKKKEKSDGKPKAVSAYKQQFGKPSAQPVAPPKKG
jgi:hypothetical protein